MAMKSTNSDYHRSHIHADDDNEDSNLYIRFPKIWEDFVEVTWGRQIFDGYKPIKYQLFAEGESYRVERYFGANENSFRLQGLAPNHQLRVQVRVLVDIPPKAHAATADANNSVGIDVNSRWMPWATAMVTTLPSVGVEVATVSSNFIHGRFTFGATAEQDKQYAAPLFDKSTPSHNFLAVKEIQFKMRDKGPFRTFEICEKIFPADQHEFTIKELQPNLVLEVEARAISGFGDVGQWCSPVRFLTLPAVEVSVVEIGETYAITRWAREEDEKNPFAEDAGIAEMVMIVDLLPSQRELDVDSQAKKQQVSAQSFSNETRMFRLRDLLPGRNYVIRSRYRNVLGDWAHWTLAPFATLCPVEAPDVQLVGHNFIQVSWRRGFEGLAASTRTVEDDSRSVQQWEVRCQVGKAATTMILPKKEMETKMVNLHSGVDYTIDVRARNDAGEWGPWSAPLVATTLHRLVPRAEAAGDTWIEASWLRRDKVYQDNITRYHVQLSAVGSTFRTAKYFPPDVTNFTFTDLRPNTKFVLVLQAFSENHWGPWSDPVEVSTCSPAVPSLVRRGEDFIQLRWNSDYYNRSSIDTIDRRYQLRVMRPGIPTAEEEQAIAERGGGVMQLSAAAPTEDIIEETTQSTFRVSHLPPFSRINVQIRMYDFHRQSWGEWGEERSFRTLPAVIVVTHVGENVAEISWSRRPRIMCAISDEEIEAGVDDTLAPQGVTKYILRVNEITGEGLGGQKEFGKYHFDEAQATLFSITGLSPDSIYTAQLSYFDASGAWSTPSAPLKFRTAPPLQIYVMDISEGHTTLKWGRWVRGEREIAVQEANFRIVLEDLSMPTTVPLQQAVQGVTQYTVTDLKPSTLYRVTISAAMHIHSQYGAWSEPIYLCTSSAMEVKLNLVGEDYAVLSWGRSVASVTALPNARFVTVTYDDGRFTTKRLAPKRNNDIDGNVIYIGDATVLEHHLQLQKVLPATEEDDASRPATELVFDAKVHASQHSLRIPNLEPDTHYKAFVCVSSHSHQWGTWSPPLTFHTAMPTAVFISSMAPEAITVRWGKLEGSDEGNSNVWRYQLRVDGVDEDFHTQVELEKDVREYQLKGLSLDACYAVAIRTHLDTESDWGQWCKPMYVIIRRIPVEVVESAQNWTHVEWKSGFKLDAAPKAQFLSLLSSGSATVTCLEPHINKYIFRNLEPSTMYAAHLITVEQSSHPIKVIPAAPPLVGARGIQAKKIIGDSKHPPSFSIPIVAADFSQFLEEGFAFRTQRTLQLRAESIGQNHILLHWSNKEANENSSSNGNVSAITTAGVVGTNVSVPNTNNNADGANAADDEAVAQLITADDTFEVEAVDGDSRKITKARGLHALLRNMKPSSTVRCAVRWVASKSDTPCDWSKPITITMLPIVEPVLGNASTDAGAAPGIGEDYLIVHWKRSLRNSNFQNRCDLTFEAKLRQLVGDGKSEEIIVTTKESGYHFTGLKANMPYDLQVRTVIPVNYHGVVEHVKGEWSQPLVCMTLSPISAVAIDVTETCATICWRRRNGDQNVDDGSTDANTDDLASTDAGGGGGGAATLRSGGGGFKGLDVNDAASEGITSFRVRVTKLNADGSFPTPSGGSSTATASLLNNDSNIGVVCDEQFTDIDEAFVTRLSRINGLQPGAKYAATVRASTGLIWGAWSDPYVFSTNALCEVDIKLVADTFVALRWERPAYDSSGELAPLTAWEASFETVASDNAKQGTSNQIDGGEDNATSKPSGGLKGDYVVTVGPDSTRYNIGGLVSNTAYAVKVRAVYGKERGSWSATRHFVTLAPLVVDVGRIGETFVLAQWHREPQTTIEARLRTRNMSTMNELRQKLGLLRQQLERARSTRRGHFGDEKESEYGDSRGGIRDEDGGESSEGEEAPLDINGLAAASAEPSNDHPSGGDAVTLDALMGGAANTSRPTNATTRNANTNVNTTAESQLSQQIAQIEKKLERAKVVGAMKVEEMAKACVYPSGHDAQFELWLRQTNTDGAGGYVFRKRLGPNETSFRVESLTPQSHYEVTVRALYTDGVDLAGFVNVGLEDSAASHTAAVITSGSINGSPTADYQEVVFAPPTATDVPTSEGTVNTSSGEGAFSATSTFMSSQGARTTATINGGKATTTPTDGRDAALFKHVPWTVWSPAAAFITLKPIVTRVKGIGSTCLVLAWDTGRIGARKRNGTAGGNGGGVSGSVSNRSTSLVGDGNDSNVSGANTFEADGCENNDGADAAADAVDVEEVGERSKTAITKFQIHLADGNEKPKDTITLTDPSTREHVVSNLRPNAAYIVAVRVCYDDDKWGVWSRPITFMTMPPLMAKLQSTAEKQVELLVWRDNEVEPLNSDAVVWRPPMTEHQLSINNNPCMQSFTLERGTSTLLTLDALAVDSEYRIAVQDKVLKHWQAFQEVLLCETIPHAPARPVLKERKGSSIVVAWSHQQSLADNHQYIYMLEMAVQSDGGAAPSTTKKSLVASKRGEVKAGSSSAAAAIQQQQRMGRFELLGFSETTEFRMEMTTPIHHCYFRVQCCKTNQTVDGEDAPVVRANYMDPQSLVVEHPGQYIWSRPSPIGHFRTPSVPDHPSGLHITNLTHNSATLHWQKPANWKEHTGLVYRVHLNNSYQDRFTCIAETEDTYLHLIDLVTNCHYRVAVTAESAMGVSVNNNTLHFSTKVVPHGLGGAAIVGMGRTNDPPKLRAANKAANSTVPPRRALTAPEEVIMSARHKAQSAAQAFAPLLDDTASTVFTAARVMGGHLPGGGGSGSDGEGHSGRGLRNVRTPEPRILSSVTGIKQGPPRAGSAGDY